MKRTAPTTKPDKPPDGGELGVLRDVPRSHFSEYLNVKGCALCDTPLNAHLSTLKKHFVRRHEDLSNQIYQAYLNEKCKQTKLPIVKSKVAENKLITLFLSKPIPMSFVRDTTFRSLLKMIPNFEPPGEEKLKGLLKDFVNDQIKAAVDTIVTEKLFYGVCVDTATMPNTKLQFLGVVIHYYNSKKRTMNAVAVDLIHCQSSTGDALRNAVTECLENLHLPLHQLTRIVGDGASAMKKGFRDRLVYQSGVVNSDKKGCPEAIDDADQVEEPNEPEVIDLEPDEEDNTDKENTDNSVPPLDELLDLVDIDKMNYDDRDLYAEGLLEAEDDDLLIESPDLIDHENYLHCFAHRLQLTMKDVFEKDSSAVQLRKNVYKQLASYSRSPNALLALREGGGKSLVFPATTRWGVLEMVYTRILEIEKRITYVSIARGFNTLLPKEFAMMKAAVKLLTPFKCYLIAVQKCKSPTISLIYTGLLHLMATIETNSKKAATEFDLFKQSQPKSTISRCKFDPVKLGTLLIERIRIRFQDVLGPEKPNSDPIFLAASALDPRVAKYIMKYKVSLEVVRQSLLRCIQQYNIEIPTVPAPEPPKKKAKPPVIRNPFGLIDDDDVDATAAVSRKQVTVNDEIDTFFRHIRSIDFYKEDALLFWFYSEDMPTLQKLFFALSSIPATSASVERLFSHLALFNDKRRNRMQAATIRMRTLGSFNNVPLQ